MDMGHAVEHLGNESLCLIGSERQASGPGSSDSHFATVREGGPGVVPAEG